MHTANWAADIYMLQDHFKIVIWSTTIYGLLFAILCKSYHFIWWNGFTKRQPKIISHLKSVVLECFFFSLALLFSLNKNRKSMRKKWNDLWCWFWIKYCQQTNTENVWNGIENKEWRSWFKLQSKEGTKKNTTENKIWELSKMIDIQQWKNLSKNFIVPIALKNHPLQRIVCMLLYDTTKTWMIRTAKM